MKVDSRISRDCTSAAVVISDTQTIFYTLRLWFICFPQCTAATPAFRYLSLSDRKRKWFSTRLSCCRLLLYHSKLKVCHNIEVECITPLYSVYRQTVVVVSLLHVSASDAQWRQSTAKCFYGMRALQCITWWKVNFQKFKITARLWRRWEEGRGVSSRFQ